MAMVRLPREAGAPREARHATTREARHATTREARHATTREARHATTRDARHATTRDGFLISGWVASHPEVRKPSRDSEVAGRARERGPRASTRKGGTWWMRVARADLGSADLGSADLGSADLGSADLARADLTPPLEKRRRRLWRVSRVPARRMG
ncbi:hypothetical protein ACFPRL_13855 [Pseudoclavibacter helvolus]